MAYKVTFIDEVWPRDEAEKEERCGGCDDCGYVSGLVQVCETFEEAQALIEDMGEPACYTPNVRVEVTLVPDDYKGYKFPTLAESQAKMKIAGPQSPEGVDVRMKQTEINLLPGNALRVKLPSGRILTLCAFHNGEEMQVVDDDGSVIILEEKQNDGSWSREISNEPN